jgi:hypothetical protein
LNCSIDYLLGNNKGTGSSEFDPCFSQISQRDDLKQLLKHTEKLSSTSVNCIINIINMIEEEVDERKKEK